MCRKLLGRLVSLGFLAGSVLILMGGEVQSQVGNGKLPSRRPKIFLNNNGSLLVTPNPNFGLPSQAPFMFIAYAHEDCRLVNNGVTIMPKFRLLAAECEQLGNNNNNNNGGIGTLPGGFTPIGICPFDGLPLFPEFVEPPFPHSHPSLCFGVGGVIPPIGGIPVIGGVNYNRHRPGVGPSYPYYPGYPYSVAGSNYSTYNPGSNGGSSLNTMDVSVSAAFRGFDLADGKAPEFMASVGTAPRTKFGTGFGLKYSTCGGCGDTDLSKPKAEKSVSEEKE
jgi:hypothetical protein